MKAGNILVAALVAVLSFVVLFGLEGWVSPPGFRGNRTLVKSNRLPFRFSLRALLIAMTLVAVVLGVIVAAT